ncbi:hypothetical protein ACQEU8_16310 [Streptomyces sp. CA-250714]
MTAVAVEITAPPTGEAPADVVAVDDLDEIVETVMCSCSAGDDQPY